MDLSLPANIEFRFIYADGMFEGAQLSSMALRLMYPDRVLKSILDGFREVSIFCGYLLIARTVRGCPSVRN